MLSNGFDSGNQLALFYSKIYPVELILKWLTCSSEISANQLSKREFSFTLPNGVYTRFQSFISAADFRARLQSQCPVKIDIGAVYNLKPSERKSINGTNFKPIEKELVFDIDMTDYDDVRNCCSDKTICRKCWKFIDVAVKIIDKCLNDDFGFKHRIWIFSGRRGIHCWVADASARKLNPQARKAIVSFIELKRGGPETRRKLTLSNPVHASLRRSLALIEESFPDIMLNDQDFLNCPKSCQTFFSMLPENFSKLLKDRWSSDEGALSSEKWTDFKDIYEESSSNGLMSPAEIAAFFLYPRLDSNVSVQLNHLLKSPFCIHPDTGKVCVCLSPDEVGSFDPSSCPTMDQVLKEYQEVADLRKTSLGPYLVTLENFVTQLLLDNPRDTELF